jgi:hypothetical protein
MIPDDGRRDIHVKTCGCVDDTAHPNFFTLVPGLADTCEYPFQYPLFSFYNMQGIIMLSANP